MLTAECKGLTELIACGLDMAWSKIYYPGPHITRIIQPISSKQLVSTKATWFYGLAHISHHRVVLQTQKNFFLKFHL